MLTDEPVVLPVEAPQVPDDELDAAVDVDVVDEVVEAVEAVVAPAAVDLVDFDAVLEVVAVTPDAMQAPSTAVAATLATPVSTRDRAAGRRRRGRGFVAFVMPIMMRTAGKQSSKRT